MTTVKEIRAWMDSFAPYHIAEEWDNSGLLLGRTEETVKGILVALDVTKEVLEEAEQKNANLILTHHPFVFSPMNRITDEDYCGELLLTAAEKRIALLCAHTNLDMAIDGINAHLCRLLGIETTEEIQPYKTGTIAREMTLQEFLKLVQETLHCYGLKYTGDLTKKIKTVGVCSGSGSDFLATAKTDVFLTADAKYHNHQQAQQLGVALVDAGHFETETIICPILVEKLKASFPEVPVTLSEVHKGFYQYF
ncbi:MAG: Nif3-like dinuclear metal center hexameric protein [Ruminococcaceae bacterium]|nr:Nif3-like dinuclear metal center hexameric protein [Oscillospiraceae bacterium]